RLGRETDNIRFGLVELLLQLLLKRPLAEQRVLVVTPVHLFGSLKRPHLGIRKEQGAIREQTRFLPLGDRLVDELSLLLSSASEGPHGALPLYGFPELSPSPSPADLRADSASPPTAVKARSAVPRRG